MTPNEREPHQFGRIAALQVAYPAESEFTGESPDGVVSLSMRGDGTVTAVKLAGTWRDALADGRLAQAVASARAAALQAIGLEFAERMEALATSAAPVGADVVHPARAVTEPVPGDRMAHLAALAAEKDELREHAFAPPPRVEAVSPRGWLRGTFVGGQLLHFTVDSSAGRQASAEGLGAELLALLRDAAERARTDEAKFAQRFPATAAGIARWSNR